MSESTRKPPSLKAAWVVRGITIPRPYFDFPLSPASSGAWQKKILGRLHYFGKWGQVRNGKLEPIPGYGWQEALQEYKAVADDLHAGRAPRPKDGAKTVHDLCNAFLAAKERQFQAGELSPRMFKPSPDPDKPELASGEYMATCTRLIVTLGKHTRLDDLGPEHFARLRADLAKQYGPTRLGTEIQKVRTVVKFALETGLVRTPILVGTEFRKPKRRVMRLHKAEGGAKVFTPEEVRRLIDAAGTQLRAMILLGVNAGLGNSDCAALPRSAIDGEWLTYPRNKTGLPRRAWLWPETRVAIAKALAERPVPKRPVGAGLVFITKYGHPWGSDGFASAVSQEMAKLLKALHINGRRGLNFYSLRHTFRTVGDSAKDVNAIRMVMGHVDEGIDATYTHTIDDSRLRAVSEHVRRWLFGTVEGGAK